jgi:DNA polymerase III subunit delta
MDLDLPEDVAEALANRCSGDKMRLLQETEKLALYVGDGTATCHDVAALCPPDVQSNIFAFVDSLAAGERDRALALLEDLIATGEPALRLTFMIRRQFQLAARARALLDRGTPQKELSSRLKVPPFVARKLEEQGRKLDEEDLERALTQIQDLEGGLKGGSDLSDELQVEMTVLSLSEKSL